MRYTAIKGKIIGPYTESGKVWTQMKDATGAALMLALEKYPVEAAMMQPTKRPTTTLTGYWSAYSSSLIHCKTLTRLHDRRSETFANDDGDEDGETKANELSRAPRQGMRSRVRRAEHERSSLRTSITASRSTSPSLETALD